MTDLFLAILLIAVIVQLEIIARRLRSQHRELINLLNDLATMVGEHFDRKDA